MWRDFLSLRHFKWRESAILSSHKGETLRMEAIPQPRGIRMRYIASAKFSFRFVTLCRTRIHGVNPIYCCAREDQLKCHAFSPRRKARR